MFLSMIIIQILLTSLTSSWSNYYDFAIWNDYDDGSPNFLAVKTEMFVTVYQSTADLTTNNFQKKHKRKAKILLNTEKWITYGGCTTRKKHERQNQTILTTKIIVTTTTTTT